MHAANQEDEPLQESLEAVETFTRSVNPASESEDSGMRPANSVSALVRSTSSKKLIPASESEDSGTRPANSVSALVRSTSSKKLIRSASTAKLSRSNTTARIIDITTQMPEDDVDEEDAEDSPMHYSSTSMSQSMRHLGGSLSSRMMSSRVLEKIDHGLQWSSLRHQGHSSEATCIASSAGMRYIVSGGTDCTTRVWKWAHDPYTCYRLVAVLQHSHTVTSVALTESSEDIKPLVVASTMEDGLLLWDMTTDTTMHHKMTGIIDVSCKNEKSDKGNWLLAVACGYQAKLLEAPSDGSIISRLKHLCTVEHEGKVTRVQHVPGALAYGAAIATCADNCVTLWSITGERLVVLQDSGLEITCFNLAPKGGGWLLAGGGRKVSIWPMRNGEVLSADSDTPVDTMNPPPLVQYEIAEGVRDVALDPHNKFIFISRQDNISELLDVHPKTPAKAVGSSGPSSRMVQSGQATTIFEVKHVGEVSEITVQEDLAAEPQLVVALTNGRLICWDLEGIDAGQRVSELRSLGLIELISPGVMVFLVFFQVYSFAFGPATSWKAEVEKPAKVAYKVALLDFDYPVTIALSRVFWIRSISVVIQMMLFIINSLLGTPDVITRMKRHISHSQAYQREVLNHELWGCAHIKVKILDVVNKAIMLAIIGCTTILAIPTFSTCFEIFDCVDRGSSKTVASAPDIICREGAHLALYVAVICLLPVYTFLLIPHTVVKGDTEYVEYPTIFKFHRWKENCERYATLQYLGYAHPYKEHAFGHFVADLFVKVLLPCISILSTKHPKVQVSAIALVGFLHLTLAMLWPPFVDRGYCYFIQGMRLLTFLGQLCGIVTVIDDARHKDKASYLLIISFFIVVAVTIVRVVYSGSKDKDDADLHEVNVEDDESDATLGRSFTIRSNFSEDDTFKRPGKLKAKESAKVVPEAWME